MSSERELIDQMEAELWGETQEKFSGDMDIPGLRVGASDALPIEAPPIGKPPIGKPKPQAKPGAKPKKALPDTPLAKAKASLKQMEKYMNDVRTLSTKLKGAKFQSGLAVQLESSIADIEKVHGDVSVLVRRIMGPPTNRMRMEPIADENTMKKQIVSIYLIHICTFGHTL